MLEQSNKNSSVYGRITEWGKNHPLIAIVMVIVTILGSVKGVGESIEYINTLKNKVFTTQSINSKELLDTSQQKKLNKSNLIEENNNAVLHKEETIPILSPVSHEFKSGLLQIPIYGGEYTMGNQNNIKDECPHSVYVSSFIISKYELTWADWNEVMGEDIEDKFWNKFKNCIECPVESVSLDDIEEFIEKANRKYRRNFRLPTEQEWEYAAKGGSESKKYVFSGSDKIGEVAWYWYNSGQRTHPVGLKKSNELGLYDMSGNVWEWTSDIWGPYPNCYAENESFSGVYVLRGGSWNFHEPYCRTTTRFKASSNSRLNNYLGVRLASD